MSTMSWARVGGPLAPFAEGFWRELLRQGHPPGGAKHHLALICQLNGWMRSEGLAAGELTTVVAGQFAPSCVTAASGGCQRWQPWRRCSVTCGISTWCRRSSPRFPPAAMSCWLVTAVIWSKTAA